MRKIESRDSLPSELVLDLLLVLFEAPRGSADLAEGVEALRGREVPLATFYRQLQKAVDAGWVETSELAPSARSGPGRPERIYRISGDGERMLRLGLEPQRRRVARASSLGLLTEHAR